MCNVQEFQVLYRQHAPSLFRQASATLTPPTALRTRARDAPP